MNLRDEKHKYLLEKLESLINFGAFWQNRTTPSRYVYRQTPSAPSIWRLGRVRQGLSIPKAEW